MDSKRDAIGDELLEQEIADKLEKAAGGMRADTAERRAEVEKVLAVAAKDLAARFGAIVTVAKGIGPTDSRGNPTAASPHSVRQAENKLRHFEQAIEAGDGEGIGVRLATMNRAQRRAFLAKTKKERLRARKKAAPAAAVHEGENTILAYGGMEDGPSEADAKDETE